jgi:hypothetical protein
MAVLGLNIHRRTADGGQIDMLTIALAAGEIDEHGAAKFLPDDADSIKAPRNAASYSMVRNGVESGWTAFRKFPP